MKTIIIADLHGCADTFRDILDRITPDVTDKLILLGDLFDRGPDSWEVFQMVKALKEARGESFIPLLGNHDDYILQADMPPKLKEIWEHVGKPTTLASFEAHGEALEDTAPWIRENTRLFYKGDGFQCVHAGISVDPIEENDFNTLIHDHRTVKLNAYAGPLTITGHIAIDAPTWFMGNGETKTFAYGEWYALPASGVICIDTGCGKGGPLTAMIIEDGSFRLEMAEDRYHLQAIPFTLKSI